MKDRFIAGLLTRLRTAAQAEHGLFPAASEAFNARYARWYARCGTPALPQLPNYCPPIAVLAQDGVHGDALLRQHYPAARLLGEGETPPETGYVLYLFKGDTLAPGALLCMAAALSRGEDGVRPDLVYADEDVLEKGAHRHPHFKSPFDMLTLCTRNTIGRPLLVQGALHARAGAPADWSEEAYYAYTLRCARLCKRPRHLSQLLLSRAALPAMRDAGARAAIDACLRAEGREGYAANGLAANSYRLRLPTEKRARVGIIVPNKNGLAALRALLESLEAQALCPHYRILIVDGGTEDLETLRYYDMLRANGAATLLYPKKSALPALWNYGAERARCSYLLFVRPGLRMLTPGYLVQLMELCRLPGAGAAGCACVDGRGAPLPEPLLSRDLLAEVPWLAGTLRACALLRGDCFMLRAETFFGAGCFDESLGETGAAADLFLRLMRRGRVNLVSPFVRAEVNAQEARPSPMERERLLDVLRPLAKEGDPFQSPRWKEVWEEGQQKGNKKE